MVCGTKSCLHTQYFPSESNSRLHMRWHSRNQIYLITWVRSAATQSRSRYDEFRYNSSRKQPRRVCRNQKWFNFKRNSHNQHFIAMFVLLKILGGAISYITMSHSRYSTTSSVVLQLPHPSNFLLQEARGLHSDLIHSPTW